MVKVGFVALEVAVQGELRDEQDLAVDVHHVPVPRFGAVPVLRFVRTRGFAGEKPCAEAFTRDVPRVVLGVVGADADEDHEPLADGRYHRAVHGDGRALDPLDDRPHAAAADADAVESG